MQLDEQELADFATRSEDRPNARLPLILAGSVIGISVPIFLSLNFSAKSWAEQKDQHGTGLEGTVGLLSEFVVPVLVSGLVGAAFGYCVWCALYSRNEVRWRLLAGGAVIGAALANLIAVTVYAFELFRNYASEETVSSDVLEDVIWLIVGPTFHGAWVGAIICWAVWSTFARRSAGPKGSAIGSAISAGLLSTIAMFIIMHFTTPPGEDHGGTGMGPRAAHVFGCMLAHVAIVLPVSVAAGAIFGRWMHRRTNRNVSTAGPSPR